MASTTLTRPPQETTVRRKERCDRCRYWEEPSSRMDRNAIAAYEKAVHFQPEAKTGMCRRNPPNSRSQSPVTLATDWCGEFR
jgi:hypothetical protein